MSPGGADGGGWGVPLELLLSFGVSLVEQSVELERESNDEARYDQVLKTQDDEGGDEEGQVTCSRYGAAEVVGDKQFVWNLGNHGTIKRASGQPDCMDSWCGSSPESSPQPHADGSVQNKRTARTSSNCGRAELSAHFGANSLATVVGQGEAAISTGGSPTYA